MPIPGTPTSVTSWGELSSRARPRASVRKVELAPAPNERRTGLDDVDAEARPCLARLPDRDRLGLSLRLNGLGLGVVDPLVRRAKCRLVDQNPVHGSRAL